MDLYEILNVDPSADEAEIKSAYRRKAKAAHPDRGGSAEEMAAVGNAWMVLRDPERRKRYDQGEQAAPDDRQARVQATLFGVINSVIDAYGVSQCDVIAEARKILRKASADCNPDSHEIKKKRRKIEEALERLDYVGNSGDILRTVITNQLAAFSEKALAEERAIIDAALACLGAYGYRHDKPARDDLSRMMRGW